MWLETLGKKMQKVTFKSLFLFVLHSRRWSQTAATDTELPVTRYGFSSILQILPHHAVVA